MNHTLLLASIIYCGAAFSQQKNSLQLKIGKPTAAAVPAKEPGDDVTIDAVSEDIVVSSRGQSFNIPKGENLAVEWDCTVGRASTTITYVCYLTNAAASTANVTAFMIRSAPLEKVSVAPPGSWKMSPSMDSKDAVINFVFVPREDRPADLLKPGVRSDAFNFESQLLPGLVELEIILPPILPKPGQKSFGELLEGVSQWANSEILRLDTRDRHVRRLVGIGPKAAPGQDSYELIRMELERTRTLPHFRVWNDELTTLSRVENSNLSSLINRLAADTPSRSALRQGLLWRLDSLSSGAR